MQHLEKLIILTLMILVLIYTIQINQTIAPKEPVSIPKLEKPIANSPEFQINEESFFPISEPSYGDEDIIEESFTEPP